MANLNSPWTFLGLFVILGFWAAAHRHLYGAVALWMIAAVFLSLTCAATVRFLAEPLVSRAQALSLNSGCLESTPVLVVLGSGITTKGQLTKNGLERVSTAATFLKDHPKTIVLCGGATRKGLNLTEASVQLLELKSQSAEVATSPIYLEEKSRTTEQNAQGFKSLALEKNLGVRLILVTGVYHMRRAEAVFTTAGFEVCALPSYPEVQDQDSDWISFENFPKVMGLVREYVAYWYYERRGWIVPTT